MAYQDSTTPTPALVLNREIALTRNFFGAIGRFFIRTATWMMENSTGHARVQAVRSLEEKSDAELAALNIRREDIVAYVFRDVYYL